MTSIETVGGLVEGSDEMKGNSQWRSPEHTFGGPSLTRRREWKFTGSVSINCEMILREEYLCETSETVEGISWIFFCWLQTAVLTI